MYGIKLYIYHLLKYPTIVGFRQLRDSCYVSAGLYFCKVVEYTNQLTNLITDENKIKSFIIDHTYSFLGDFYNNKIPFINK